MSKPKVVPKKSMVIRIPKPMYERLLRISADRSIRAGKRVSVGALLVESVERDLAAV